jgi:hypothetical protein
LGPEGEFEALGAEGEQGEEEGEGEDCCFHIVVDVVVVDVDDESVER